MPVGAEEIIEDPFLARYSEAGYADLQPIQSKAISEVIAQHSAIAASTTDWARRVR
jgi:hypothetical protein